MIEIYRSRLNLQNAIFKLVEHEDTMVAIVYKITLPTGESFILKICPDIGHYLKEVHFLQHFAKEHRIRVPHLIQTVSPEKGLDPAILMECLPGSVIKMEDCTLELSFEMGKQLAQIHLNRTNGYGDLIYPHELTSDPRIHFSEKFEESLSECYSHLPVSLIKECRSYFDAHIDLLEAAVGPCITHRDFRPGNIVALNGKIQGIIDWASARAGFAQEDFCPLEHGEWPSHCKAAFLEGYGKIPEYSEMMPLLRLSKAIATIGFTVKRETWEGTHQRIYQFNRRFLDFLFSYD